ncbi:hypothetical protein PN836_010765 [Ningiella sp. W23]|uniref:hypothetical protein n=1 Tax=Ningiella sp. W23 TaxID=3023715 RepID=UPI0037566CE8
MQKIKKYAIVGVLALTASLFSVSASAWPIIGPIIICDGEDNCRVIFLESEEE